MKHGHSCAVIEFLNQRSPQHSSGLRMASASHDWIGLERLRWIDSSPMVVWHYFVSHTSMPMVSVLISHFANGVCAAIAFISAVV